MKNLILVLLFLSATLVNAQIYDPIKWKTSVKKVSVDQYDLIATAIIDPGWHLYSQNVPEDGPLPTTFIFEEEGIELLGSTKEDVGIKVNDPVFGMVIKYFSNQAVFVQRVKGKEGNEVYAEVEFMVCDDTKCLPPMYGDLVFTLK